MPDAMLMRRAISFHDAYFRVYAFHIYDAII